MKPIVGRRMPKKRKKPKRTDINPKAIEKRLQRYGDGDARDQFGKPTSQLAKAKPLQGAVNND